ncbi:MAG: glutamate racemase [Ruminococcaceae bacterium]|nr:glutamate racemase [Oscillospiraceae bacterium]
MNKRPIGVFDSGLGGLTAVRELEAILPGEKIVYFGDTGRVPYGTRGRDVIRRYTEDDCAFLERFDVKMIIAACGTVSSVAGDIIHSRAVPAVDVVEPTAREAVAATRNKKIGIIGTAATVKSGSYAKVIEALLPEAEVFGQECPMLVPLVENGWIGEDDRIAALAVERYLEPLKEQGIDTLILGCTHFPLLVPHIAAYLGKDVALISAGAAAAKAAAGILAKDEKLSDGEGGTQFFVSDKGQNFKAVAKTFLGRECEDVNVVDINSL